MNLFGGIFLDQDWERMIVNREPFLKSQGAWVEERDRPMQNDLETEFFARFHHYPNKAFANEKGFIWPEYHQPYRKCVCCDPPSELEAALIASDHLADEVRKTQK